MTFSLFPFSKIYRGVAHVIVAYGKNIFFWENSFNCTSGKHFWEAISTSVCKPFGRNDAEQIFDINKREISTIDLVILKAMSWTHISKKYQIFPLAESNSVVLCQWSQVVTNV